MTQETAKKASGILAKLNIFRVRYEDFKKIEKVYGITFEGATSNDSFNMCITDENSQWVSEFQKMTDQHLKDQISVLEKQLEELQ